MGTYTVSRGGKLTGKSAHANYIPGPNAGLGKAKGIICNGKCRKKREEKHMTPLLYAKQKDL